MISLYIHIPFCKKKCKYCSFFVTPKFNDNFMEKYYQSLLNEINFRSLKLKDKSIKTIYIWGWTPFVLWKERIFWLVDFIKEKFDLNFLEEVSIELNPNPYHQILDFVKTFTKRYKDFYRIRFSFGLQTFNDEILITSWREYVFNSLVGFLRDLQNIKWVNNVFNFDFIAFGIREKWSKDSCFRKPHKCQFFERFVNSGFADSFSIYMLELSPWSYWYNIKEFNFSDDEIYEEFLYLKNLIKKAWYRRYEVSNFALPGKESLHNLVYWKLWNWLGLGVNSTSYFNLSDKNQNIEEIFGTKIEDKIKWIKFQNTTSWQRYFEGNFIDAEKTEFWSNEEYLYHKFIMWIRLKEGISEIKKYISILVPDYKNKISILQNEWFVDFDGYRLRLTDKWMDFSNYIINELLK